MNIHEHQAKQLLKKFGAIVPNGEACFTVQEVLEKAKKLNLKKYVLKAQIPVSYTHLTLPTINWV